MVLCCAIKCRNRSGVSDCSFYRFPSYRTLHSPHQRDLVSLRRALWIARIGRKGIAGNEQKIKNLRICSYHFVNGEPADLDDTKDVDWAPTLELGHNFYNLKTIEPPVKTKHRSRRYLNRILTAKKPKDSSNDLSLDTASPSIKVEIDDSNSMFDSMSNYADSNNKFKTNASNSNVTIIYVRKETN